MAKKKIPKPKMIVKQVYRRLEFVEGHGEWTVDCKRVVWPDETKITNEGNLLVVTLKTVHAAHILVQLVERNKNMSCIQPYAPKIWSVYSV